jgi:hypothetical protein
MAMHAQAKEMQEGRRRCKRQYRCFGGGSVMVKEGACEKVEALGGGKISMEKEA